jgi:transcriptional regulator GlxA family with amidase domain
VLRHLLLGILAGGCPPDTEEQLAETALDLLSAALRPFAPGHSAQAPLGGDALRHAARVYIERHYADPGLDVSGIARRHSVSRRHLELAFARAGESPAAYLREVRLAAGRRLVEQTPRPVTAIAHEVGFSDINTFTRAFRRAHDATPRDWRRAGPPGS